MKTETKILGIIFAITVIILFGGIYLLSRGSSGPAKSTSDAVLQIDYSKGERIGSESAKIKLVEFSDLECPACLAAEPAVKSVLAKYPNDLQFIYRHFPLPQHPHSKQVAYLVEAAGEQGKFWEMHDKLFETQSQWSKMSDATPFLMDLVNQLGIDGEKVKKALDENKFNSKVEEDIAEARRLGVNSTPTFYLNGRKVNVVNSYDELNAAVAEELKK